MCAFRGRQIPTDEPSKLLGYESGCTGAGLGVPKLSSEEVSRTDLVFAIIDVEDGTAIAILFQIICQHQNSFTQNSPGRLMVVGVPDAKQSTPFRLQIEGTPQHCSITHSLDVF